MNNFFDATSLDHLLGEIDGELRSRVYPGEGELANLLGVPDSEAKQKLQLLSTETVERFRRTRD